jgi:hypothetical protein
VVADAGKDVSRFFTNRGRMQGPIQRVNVDLTAGMLEELDRAAKGLNISRQAVIKTLIRQALDQQYLSRGGRASPGRNRLKSALASALWNVAEPSANRKQTYIGLSLAQLNRQLSLRLRHPAPQFLQIVLQRLIIGLFM